ncbi:MAG: histidine--tRNA ligase [Candidatus Krumholzibacteria bacterium]|jgi:histidyl-tRNA synthetase|nr:histidine--tRNA ligase [Candidatus Krumholzibacteria bacterium]
MYLKYRRLKGTRDILLEEAERWRWCEERWVETLARYGYGEIRTPVIEPVELFLRSVGEGTDIVDKEMYAFETKGGERLVLRPEMTASVARAYLENGLTRQPGTLKFWYLAPMFRHDRPQAGRYRQFHQVGVEAIGSSSPVLDAEVIQTLLALFDAVDARDLTLLLNSTGCPVCRPGFVASLRAHLAKNRERVPASLRDRIERNPLRLYDAKDDDVAALLAEHPPQSEHLCGDCRAHHSQVKASLDDLGIAYEDDPTLVRGLDYYTRTTFEVTARSERKQSSLAGGGRYDNLIEQCGGTATPAIGFSLGIERTLLHLDEDPVDPQRSRQSVVDVYVACSGEAAQRYALAHADILRDIARVEIDLSGRGLKAQIKGANLRLARILLVVGDNEIRERVFQFKNLATGTQEPVPRDEIVRAVREVLEQ